MIRKSLFLFVAKEKLIIVDNGVLLLHLMRKKLQRLTVEENLKFLKLKEFIFINFFDNFISNQLHNGWRLTKSCSNSFMENFFLESLTSEKCTLMLSVNPALTLCM